MNITISTRSQNEILYARMRSFIPEDILCIEHVGYSLWEDAATVLHDAIEDAEDILLVLDEDAFITDWNAVKSLCDYVKQNGYTHAGVPDGGVIHHRFHSYLQINPFFVIFNCKIINPVKAKTSRALIDDTKFTTELQSLKPDWITGNYNHDYIEPFAGFFYWLSKIGKPLFLNASTSEDTITTEVKGLSNETICLHSWYSRFYDIDNAHKARIDKVYETALRLKSEKIFSL